MNKWTPVSSRSITNNGKSTKQSPWASITLPDRPTRDVVGIVTFGRTTKYFFAPTAVAVLDQIDQYIAAVRAS